MAADTTKKHFIRIRGANVNNLKNLSVDIPRDKFVVFTGLSGSGKSSLAFDTIYAEGQRRYMESLSSYARQFLGQMEKPDVESIEGLPPAISIDQKSTNRNPRSTVGTVTEIYDYFRLLYARVGIPHCPKCGREIKKQTVDQMVDSIMSFPERTKIQLLAPVVRGRKGTHAKLLEQAKRSGYVRVQIDGNLYELSEEISLDKNIKHNIEIVVDRLIVKPGIEKRLSDSIETVLDLAEGLLMVDTMDGNIHNFSQSFSCPDCGISVDEIEPRSFSFNNPFGACPDCLGLGYKMEFDIDLMIPDRSLSILDGAIVVTGWQSSGLLQHNLRHPCIISIVLISPWKNPLIIPVPFYQRLHNLFKYHNLSFPRLFTVHSILSNAAKIHFRLPVAIGFWPVCHFITKQKKTLIHKNKKDRTHFTVSRSFLPYSLFFTF